MKTKFSLILFAIIAMAILLLMNINYFVYNVPFSVTYFLATLIIMGFISIATYICVTAENQRNKLSHIKVGLDIHGMIDHDPKFFAELSRVLVASGHEVHIMTGSHITDAVIEELKRYNMHWTELFSIADYYKTKKDVQMWYDEQNRPWVSPELWNQAKAKYAEAAGLDLTLDDTASYQDYFVTSVGICKIINKSGKVHRPKAVMPDAPKI